MYFSTKFFFGARRVPLVFKKKKRKKEIKDKTQGKALANLVPAAAVIREGQVLFIMTGRKGSVGGLSC